MSLEQNLAKQAEERAELTRILAEKRAALSLEEEYNAILAKQAEELNEAAGVSPQQREAMLMGSMFGWGIPAADPDCYIHAEATH